MSKRKTVTVEHIKERVNSMLANSADDVKESRIALAIFLEGVLMETGNYKGFGHVPGTWDFTKSPPEMTGDETRRQYY